MDDRRCTVGCPLLQVCTLGWVKCREHISLLIILCIIVYVTNKAHPSLICCCCCVMMKLDSPLKRLSHCRPFWTQCQHGRLAVLGCNTTDSLGRGCPEWQEADPVLCLSSPLTPLVPSLATPLLTEEPLTHYGSSHSRPLPKVRLHYTLEREWRSRKNFKLLMQLLAACSAALRP